MALYGDLRLSQKNPLIVDVDVAAVHCQGAGHCATAENPPRLHIKVWMVHSCPYRINHMLIIHIHVFKRVRS